MWVEKQQLEPNMEQWTGSELRKEYVKAVYVTLLIYLLQNKSCKNARMHELPVGIKISRRNINNLRCADGTLMAETKEELKSLLMREKESKKPGLNSTFKKLRSSHPVPSFHSK